MYNIHDNLSRRLHTWKQGRAFANGVSIDADLLDQLRSQRQSLIDLSQGIEDEFCALGTQLQEMSGKAGEISSLSAHLMDVTLGRKKEGALQFAYHLFKKSLDLIEASDDEYTGAFQYLLTFGERIDMLCRSQAQLQRIGTTFTAIILTFRMEAERLPPDGRSSILSLAANIDTLCQRLRHTIDEQFAQLTAMRVYLQKTVQEMIERVDQHRQEVGQRKSAIRSHLGSLQATLQSSGAMGTSVAAAAKYITDHIGQIVVAIQYHDISRQKLHHVIAALEEFCTLAEKAAAHPHETGAEVILLGYLHEILVIQVRQLGVATRELSNAGRGVVSNMQGVVNSTLTLAKDASFTSQATGTDDGDGIIGAFLNEITAINLFVACGAEINEALVNTIRPVGEMVSTFTRLTRGLSMQIRVTALNAQVQASHWLQGGALDMLAGQTSATANQTIDMVDGISEQLKAILGNVQTLDQQLSGFLLSGEKEQQILQEEACTATSKLHAMSTNFAASIERIRELQATLSADTEPILRSIRFPERVETCAGEVTAAFGAIIERTVAAHQLCGDNQALRSMVEQLTARYTMDHERAVHRSAAGEQRSKTPDAMGIADSPAALPADAAAQQVDAPATAAAGADLGENIELF